MKWSASALLLAFALTVAPSHADGTSGEVALAREQFERGVAAAQSGRWADAREAFARAYDLHPHPTTLLNLAGAEAETGRVVAAAEHYRKVVRDAAVTAEERAAAEQALARVEKRAARVRVVVDGRRLAADRVEIDGAAIASAAVGEDLPIDPGEHAAVLKRNGAEVARRGFALREAESRTVSLDAPAPPATPAPATAETSGGGLLASPWFWAAVGVVVVGGTFATVCAAGACSGSGGAHPATGNAGPNIKLP